MNIKSVNIKNFTVFDDFELDVSSGINIIIGNNGTAKTHLLKGLYAVCESVNYENKSKSNDPYDISQLYFKVNPMELVRDKIDRDKETSITVNYLKGSYAKYVIIKHKGIKLAGDGSSYKFIDFNIMIFLYQQKKYYLIPTDF